MHDEVRGVRLNRTGCGGRTDNMREVCALYVVSPSDSKRQPRLTHVSEGGHGREERRAGITAAPSVERHAYRARGILQGTTEHSDAT